MKLNRKKSLIDLLLVIAFVHISFNKKLKKRKRDVSHQMDVLKNTIKDKVFIDNINCQKTSAKLQKYIAESLFNFEKDPDEKKRLETVSNHWSEGYANENFVTGEDNKVQREDEKSAERILDLLKREFGQKFDSVIEFAAGVGRLTKRIFINYFNSVDAVEPAEPLANKIEELKNSKESKGKINKVYHKGGADFEFERKYDMIFGQWFIENMNDLDVLKFVLRAKDHLNPKGRLFLRENASSFKQSKVTEIGQKIRQRRALSFLFELCGLRVVMLKISDNNPEDYWQLYEFVLEKDE